MAVLWCAVVQSTMIVDFQAVSNGATTAAGKTGHFQLCFILVFL